MRTVIALVLALGVSQAEASPSEIRIYESQDESPITLADTTITVDPDQAYQAVSDYHRWSEIFPDIRQVVVSNQQGADARVTLVHAGGNRDNVHFHNRPATRVVWFEDTGGRAEVWAEIAFLPGDLAGTTRVHARLFADVHGVASLFVSDAKLRGLRHDRIRQDLANLHTYFSRQIASTP